MMPHAIRRVYVARRARSAASIAIWLMGAATLVCAMSPKLTAYLTKGMPGINPALLSTLVMAMWVLGIVAYCVARARCEHHFQVAISKTVLPSENPDEDIDRLSHEHPDEVARGMAHELEVRSSAWPVAAAAMLIPMTLLYGYFGIKTHDWPAIVDYEQSLAANAPKLLFLAVIGSFAAILTTHRAFRQSSTGMWMLSLGVLSFPATGWLASLFIITLSIGFVVRKLRKERSMLETNDPAAGSEMFTWRGFITSVASTLEGIGSKLDKRQGRIALVAGIAAVATLGFVTGRRTHVTVQKPAPAAAQVMPQQLFVNKESGSSYKITPSGTSWRVDVTLTNEDVLDIHFPGIAEIPVGWTARMTMQSDSAPALYLGRLDMTTDEVMGNPAANNGGYSISACMGPIPFGLKAKGQPGTYVVVVTPVLEPAGC